jgi:hypothetical protein
LVRRVAGGIRNFLGRFTMAMVRQHRGKWRLIELLGPGFEL